LELAPEHINELLDAARRGDAAASERLFSALYDELRRIARRERRRVNAGETLNTTAVVHEAYVRLLHDREMPWESRAHLLGTAAVAMRRLLVDRARERQALKRGGGEPSLELDADVEVAATRASEEMLALDGALGRLEQVDPRLARVVELRFFGGLSEEETGRILGVAERTVRRDWLKAKAFLHAQLSS
jgi:RNA polymerase sigma factor (TIGR02999 family)